MIIALLCQRIVPLIKSQTYLDHRRSRLSWIPFLFLSLCRRFPLRPSSTRRLLPTGRKQTVEHHSLSVTLPYCAGVEVGGALPPTELFGSGHFPWTYSPPGRFPLDNPPFENGVGHPPFHRHHPRIYSIKRTDSQCADHIHSNVSQPAGTDPCTTSGSAPFRCSDARRSSHTHRTGPSRFFCCCSIHLELLSTC